MSLISNTSFNQVFVLFRIMQCTPPSPWCAWTSRKYFKGFQKYSWMSLLTSVDYFYRLLVVKVRFFLQTDVIMTVYCVMCLDQNIFQAIHYNIPPLWSFWVEKSKSVASPQIFFHSVYSMCADRLTSSREFRVAEPKEEEGFTGSTADPPVDSRSTDMLDNNHVSYQLTPVRQTYSLPGPSVCFHKFLFHITNMSRQSWIRNFILQ